MPDTTPDRPESVASAGGGSFAAPLPRGAGTAVFAGGAWLPRTGSGGALDDAVVLAHPCRVLTARRPDEVAALLDEVEVLYPELLNSPK